MVGQDKLNHCFAGIEYPDGVGVYNHSFGAVGGTGRSKVTASFNFDNTNTATTGFVFDIHVTQVHVTQGGYVDSYFFGSLQNGSSLFDFNKLFIYDQFDSFHT
jgi:hypothetical protein